jgi:ribosome-associated heat shock protein Hsp15
MEDHRLDKVLWSLRVFKTRPLATAACRDDKVSIGGHTAKPGRNVHVGEIVVVRLGQLTRTIKLIGVPDSRVGAKLLPDYLVDLTPPAEYEQAKQAAKEHSLAREQGVVGRPTKKLRRDIAKLLGFE